ncbi:fad oxidoreductase-like protein [Leptotrombidium deliense]|uniref:FAD-dependent oxidoreductase domain-containing protein 1 n=1 Tax=Leptotrombidium deliense TaxID=299467 RepID=A0A443ST65_9ACAR|nr:fad oxidoreductase-like protein [Leptotrombidium deliense]
MFASGRSLMCSFPRRCFHKSLQQFSDLTAELEENCKLTAEELRRKLREKQNPEEIKMTGYRYPSLYIDPNATDFNTMKRRREEIRFGVKKETDILIIGGGVIGSAVAYFLKQRAPDSFDVTVVEKDPEYTHSATSLSIGGLRQQFSLPENIQMANFSAQFFRQLRFHLTFLDSEPPDIEFTPKGYLFLGNEQNSNDLLSSHELQTELGTFADVLNKDQLKQKFPWLNTSDLLIGSYGVQNEGWFNPRHLLLGLKGKAEFLGAHYLQGEVIDFNIMRKHASAGHFDELGLPWEKAHNVLIRIPNGHVVNITFARGVIAAGAKSGEVSKLLRLGEAPGVREVPLPIEPRKRYVYAFHCPDGPCLDFPFLVDPSGVYCRRDGIGGNYIVGKNPTEDEEPDCSNLDVDYNYFHEVIHPILCNRVPAFKDIKLTGAWAGFYDYNTFDQSPIIGPHPYYRHIFWATGFGGHGVQMAPAVGRAINEQILDAEYTSLDLRRFEWSRLFTNQKIRESLLL